MQGSNMEEYPIRKLDELPMLSIEIESLSRDSGSFSFGSKRIKMNGNDNASIVNERKKGRVKTDAAAGRHEHLMKSGPLGRCNDPLCTSCPAYFDFDYPELKHNNTYKASALSGRLKSFSANLWESFPRGIINPHTKFMQRWNKFFVISCLIAIFMDPIFFFLLAVKKDYKCIVIDHNFSTVMIVIRSMTDFIYFCHILLQFRLAYVGPVSHRKKSSDTHDVDDQTASWDVVDDPLKIARNYLTGWFAIDLIAVLPLPQIMIAIIVPRYLGKSAGANIAKNIIRVTLLLQYVPRIIRFLPLLSGHTPTGFIFETAWANFVINLLIYFLSGHVVGSCWYLFGLQRVNQCLHDACRNSTTCNKNFLDCGKEGVPHGITDSVAWDQWKHNLNATNCFDENPYVFTYGIYLTAVPVTTQSNSVTRYLYSVFWGFQQITTLAGNQMPSLFLWEIVFVMTVIGLGLLLLTLLIGNMQNFLQSLGRRDLEMQLRRYEVEKWMVRRNLPTGIRRRVRKFERLNWAATRGINERELLQDLPEDLFRSIRRVLFGDLVKKVHLLDVMDEQLLDAIFQRLHQKLYVEGSEIFRVGAPVHRMLFILHGRLESEGVDGSCVMIHGGDICGEELLTWCLEHAAVLQHAPSARIGNTRLRSGQRAVSTRRVRCVTSVEAFSLEAGDLEEVTRDYSRLLRNPKVQTAIRYESQSWRTWAAITIQVYWRYRKRKLSIATSSSTSSTIPRHRHHHRHHRHHLQRNVNGRQ